MSGQTCDQLLKLTLPLVDTLYYEMQCMKNTIFAEKKCE